MVVEGVDIIIFINEFNARGFSELAIHPVLYCTGRRGTTGNSFQDSLRLRKTECSTVLYLTSSINEFNARGFLAPCGKSDSKSKLIVLIIERHVVSNLSGFRTSDTQTSPFAPNFFHRPRRPPAYPSITGIHL